MRTVPAASLSDDYVVNYISPRMFCDDTDQYTDYSRPRQRPPPRLLHMVVLYAATLRASFCLWQNLKNKSSKCFLKKKKTFVF